MVDEPSKRIDCIHFVPAKKGVERWHCEIGDWFEGDCSLLHGHHVCDYQNKQIPFNDMFSAEEIVKGSKRRWTSYLWYAIGVIFIIGSIYTAWNVGVTYGTIKGHKMGISFGISLAKRHCEEKITDLAEGMGL